MTRVAFVAKSKEPVLARNQDQISENRNVANIEVANRFDNLEIDMISAEIQDVAISGEGNKENEYMGNTSKAGGNISQGKGIKNVGQGEKPKFGLRDVGKERRAQGVNNSELNGLKVKPFKSTRPVRGLVFGPTKDELELSESGKRLRVEKGSVGRRGGAFARERAGVPMENESSQDVLQVTDITHLESNEEGRKMDVMVNKDPPEGVAVQVVRNGAPRWFFTS